jgi:hypothetical protein
MGLFERFKNKQSNAPIEEPEFLKEIDKEPEGIKQEVEPELALWLTDGTTAKSMKELAAALKKLPVKNYREHVNPERNEIADWVGEILNDTELAQRLRAVTTKLKAAQFIEKRIRELKAEQRSGKRKEAFEVQEEPVQPITEMKFPETKKAAFWPFGKKEEELKPLPELPKKIEKMPEPALPAETAEAPEPESPALPELSKQTHWPFKRTKAEQKVQALPDLPEPEVELQVPSGPVEWPKKFNDPEAPSPGPAEEKPKAAKEIAQESKTFEEAALDKKEEELETVEKELNGKEDELNKKRLELTRKRYDLIKQKGEIEKAKFELFMRKQKEKKSVPIDEYAPKPVKGMPDFKLAGPYAKQKLESLLEQAKQYIHANNMGAARAAFHEAQLAFGTAYMKSDEKKQMEYELLEVEADLRLASIG